MDEDRESVPADGSGSGSGKNLERGREKKGKKCTTSEMVKKKKQTHLLTQEQQFIAPILNL